MKNNLKRVRHYFKECLGVLSTIEVTRNDNLISNATRVEKILNKYSVEQL